MTQWLSELELVKNISRELMEPRQQHYSQDAYRISLEQHPLLKMKHIQPINRFGQRLYGVLIDSRVKQSEYCLIFMHGLGSNILQGSILIEHLSVNMALCCFDFSGSGKSQGSCNAYGTKEYQDISSIINYLELQGYNKFILWGRSMGAFASLAYTTSVNTHNIVLQILDSPFGNFEDVCKNRARNHFKIPQIFVDTAVNLLKRNMSNHQFSPFTLDLGQKAQLCKIHTFFVYNERDDVIPNDNTEKLIQQLSKNCSYERLIIDDQHSSLRCKQTLSLIFEQMRKFIFRRENILQKGNCKKKALNVYSGFLKKSEHYKRTSQITDKYQKKQKRKGALFCSLSKQLYSCVNAKGIKILRQSNPESKQF